MKKVMMASWGLFSLALLVAGIIMTAVTDDPACRGHRECTTAELRSYEAGATSEERQFRAFGVGILVLGIFSSAGWVVMSVRHGPDPAPRGDKGCLVG